jgi:hypothetical protein
MNYEQNHELKVCLTINDYVKDLEETVEKAYAVVRENAHVAAQRRKRIYDANVKVQEFRPKQLVLVFQPRSWRRRSPKWSRSWRRRSPKWSSYYIGPCLVERRINTVTYVVKRSPNGKSFTVHVDNLKLFRGTVPTARAKYCEDPETVSDELAGPAPLQSKRV